jgi:hypothetical protein
VVENKPPKPLPSKGKKPGRDRLADALRDNLKRRKAQARAKATEPAQVKPKEDRD